MIRLGRLTACALIAICVLPLAGCSPYPDGAVVRRADGYVARSNCGPGSSPRLVSVHVSVSPPSGQKQAAFEWSATAASDPVYEIPLFKPSNGVDVTANPTTPIAPGSKVNVGIETTTSSWGGATFRWDSLQVGEARSFQTLDPVTEANLPGPDWWSVDCGGPWSIGTVVDIARIVLGVIAVGGIALAVIIVRRRRMR